MTTNDYHEGNWPVVSAGQDVLVQCPTCPLCDVQSTMTVPMSGFLMRQQGALVQQAFPDMPVEVREMLVSGTHPECWTAEFGIDWDV